MKFSVQIYDEAYLINAKALDGAIPPDTQTSLRQHCQPSRISGNSTFCDDRNASFSAKQHTRTRLLMWFTKPTLDLV
jgi:hypothetical protein